MGCRVSSSSDDDDDTSALLQLILAVRRGRPGARCTPVLSFTDWAVFEGELVLLDEEGGRGRVARFRVDLRWGAGLSSSSDDDGTSGLQRILAVRRGRPEGGRGAGMGLRMGCWVSHSEL